ncbi:hypothetical protein [Sphingomonas sp. 1P08PE]|uniref:hypothetical protein n=1 Tax=Sphingomonas sp. 1P08PE TaxID=554122 RepID=UPI0039A252EB
MTLPPPAIEQCVVAGSPAALHSGVIWNVAGPTAAMNDLLGRADPRAWSTPLVDETKDGRRRMVLKLNPAAEYRGVGGFIYVAQTLKLDLTSRFDPPICGTDQN